MPAVASLTDFNRSPNTMLNELKTSQKPMYLTKNGKACAVIMDAEAFDRMLAERDELRSREERVYRGILQGIEEFHRGDTTPAKDGFAAIREHKGWR